MNPVVAAAALARLDAACAAAGAAGGRGDAREEASAFSGAAASALEPEPDGGASAVAAAEDAAAEAERLLRFADERRADLRAVTAASSTNPRDAEVASLRSQVDAETASALERKAETDRLEARLGALRAADAAFGSRGIQSYLFEGALAELSARVGAYMDALTGGALTLALAPAAAPGKAKGSKGGTKRAKQAADAEGAEGSDGAEVGDDASADERGAGAERFGGASAEKIEKIAHARGLDGARTRRSLRQLSGGERRRAALALALAHADLAAARGGVHCDLLVLDEVLQHLPRASRAWRRRCARCPRAPCCSRRRRTARRRTCSTRWTACGSGGGAPAWRPRRAMTAGARAARSTARSTTRRMGRGSNGRAWRE